MGDTNYNVGITTNTGTSAEDIGKIAAQMERMNAAAKAGANLVITPKTATTSVKEATDAVDKQTDAVKKTNDVIDQSKVKIHDYATSVRERALRDAEGKSAEQQAEEKLARTRQINFEAVRRQSREARSFVAAEEARADAPAAASSKTAEKTRDLKKHVDALAEVAEATKDAGEEETTRSGKAVTQARSLIAVANAAQNGIGGMSSSLTSLALAFGGGAGLAGGIGLTTSLLGVFYDELKKGGVIVDDMKVDINEFVEKALTRFSKKLRTSMSEGQDEFKISQALGGPNLAKRRVDDQEFDRAQKFGVDMIGILQKRRALTGEIDDINRDAAVQEQTINAQRDLAINTAKKAIQDRIRDQKELLVPLQDEYDEKVRIYNVALKEQEAARKEYQEAERNLERIVKLQDQAKEEEPDPIAFVNNYMRSTAAATAAKEQLLSEDPDAAEKNVASRKSDFGKASAEVSKFADESNKNAGIIREAAETLGGAAAKLAETQAETAREMAGVILDADKAATEAKLAMAASVSKDIIPKLQEVTRLAEGQGGRVGTAVTSLNSIIADSNLTVDELARVPGLLATVIARFSGNKDELLKNTEGLAAAAFSQKARITQLTADVERLQREVASQKNNLPGGQR